MRNFLLFLTLALVVLTSLMLFATKDRTEQDKTMAETAGSGVAQVGGDFTLTDQNGKTVHESDFRGRLMLVFFGFTHCPDICPVSTAILSQVMSKLGSKADSVAPLFITVDPKRDTPPVLKAYLAPFDRHMIGLTGTPEQIEQVTHAYKAYAATRETDPSTHEAHEAHDHDHHDNAYTVDHSGFIYLMGKDGRFIRLFPYNADAGEITRAVLRALER
jgi:protein SCO1/2